MVNVASDGTHGNGTAFTSDISPDGRFVAFSSRASNLVPGDTNGRADVFLRDRQTGQTTRVSMASSGAEGNRDSLDASISADGRYVAFSSRATNLVPGSTVLNQDIFLRDTVAGTTIRVSVSFLSGFPKISANGRYVAYWSGDNVFVYDLVTSQTTRASVAPGGVPANGMSSSPSISADGRYVAFASTASNLVPDDTNGRLDVFVHDRLALETFRVSVGAGGQGDGDSGQVAGLADFTDISPDGRFVAFKSSATNLVAGDTNGKDDIFVHDRATRVTERVSVASDGMPVNAHARKPSISSDGRYVAFQSLATNLATGDTNGGADIFIRDRVSGTTERVSVTSDGTQANYGGLFDPFNPPGSENYGSINPSLSDDGRAVAFTSRATNLVSGGSRQPSDAFLRQLSSPQFITASLASLYGDRASGGYAGDPVNTAVGNLTETDIDLDFPVFGLDWTRTYNSLNAAAGPLGVGWSLGFGAQVQELPSGEVTFTDRDGRITMFHPTGEGFDRPSEVLADLYRQLDGTLALRFFNGEVWDFDSRGQLETRSNWDGQTVRFSYDPWGSLVAATSSAGYSLAFNYDSSGRMAQVAASDGRRISYTYGASGGLASATDAAGGTTSYVTDQQGRIERITDPDGTLIIASTFDARGRVATQTTPSGDTLGFAYDDATGVTTVVHSASGAVTRYAHDEAGRLVSITDAHGAVLTKGYDGNGNLISVVDRRGAGTTQAFDGHGNLLRRSGPEGVVESFTYDVLDRIISATDGESAITTYSYDGSERLPSAITNGKGAVTAFDVVDGLVHSATDADGATLQFGYDTRRNRVTVTDGGNQATTSAHDPAGNVTSITSPTGRRTAWSYDGRRRVVARTDPLGSVATSEWTAGGRLASTTDEAGATTTFAYDTSGRLATVTDPLGRQTSYGYDPDGNLRSMTRPGGATWSATYDKLGRRLSETDAAGVTTRYGYDLDGNLTTSTDAAGETTSRAYDLRGRLTNVTDPLHRTSTFEYDQADRLLSMTDPAGTTRFAYDAAGQVVEKTDAAAQRWAWSYTPAGRVASATDPNLQTAAHAYDPLGRLDSTTDAEGGITDYAYDADGRLLSVRTPTGLVTTYQRDPAGRLIQITDPAGVTETRTYTPRGEVASVADGTGDAARFAYDPAGHLAEAVDRNGGLTRYAYDPRGNLTARTDANGGVERYTWDLADRLLTHADQLNRTTTMAYDPLGRLASVADASGRSVGFTYDAAGQVTDRAFGDGTAVGFGYDTAGRRTSMTDATGTTSYAYDPLGHLTSVTTPDGKSLVSAYDPAGRRSTLTYPDGRSATFSYDDADRLVGVAHPDGGSTTYTRDADGRLLREVVAGGPTRAWSYASGRLVTFTEANGAVTKATNLGYDADGRLASEVIGSKDKVYSYDPAGQLTQVIVNGPGGADDLAYTYDRVGNHLTEARGPKQATYRYDPAHQLVSALSGDYDGDAKDSDGNDADDDMDDDDGQAPGGWTFTYDGAGRLTNVQAPLVHRTITYDSRGLPRTVATGRTGQARWETTRTYDGDGILRAATTLDAAHKTTQTKFVWDLVPAVAQIATQTTGTDETDFLYGEERIAALRAGQADPFSYDAHGSALAAGEAANLAVANDYDPVGRPGTARSEFGLLGLAGDPASDNAPRFGYRGELRLNGLIHLRNRDYDPGTGRFTTPDPLDGIPGEPTVANPYAYAANSPLDQIDPLGLSPVRDCDLQPAGCASEAGPGGLFGVFRGVGGAAWDTVEGAVHIATNPTQLWRIPENAYRAAGGGWGGANEAINQFNPFYHALFSADACLNAIDTGAAYDAGHGCTSLIIDSAATAGLAAGGAAAAARRLPTQTAPQASRLVPGGGLAAHEAAGGHVLTRHLGLSDSDLLARLANQPNISGASTFANRAVAESSVAGLLDANAAGIQSWLQTGGNQLILRGDGAGITGRYVTQGSSSVIDVSGVQVLLRADPSLGLGYRIHTAYPVPLP